MEGEIDIRKSRIESRPTASEVDISPQQMNEINRLANSDINVDHSFDVIKGSFIYKSLLPRKFEKEALQTKDWDTVFNKYCEYISQNVNDLNMQEQFYVARLLEEGVVKLSYIDKNRFQHVVTSKKEWTLLIRGGNERVNTFLLGNNTGHVNLQDLEEGLSELLRLSYSLSQSDSAFSLTSIRDYLNENLGEEGLEENILRKIRFMTTTKGDFFNASNLYALAGAKMLYPALFAEHIEKTNEWKLLMMRLRNLPSENRVSPLSVLEVYAISKILFNISDSNNEKAVTRNKTALPIQKTI